MRHSGLLIAFVLSSALTPAAQVRDKLPETFTANANVNGPAGAAATAIDIHFEKYSRDQDRDGLLKEFNSGGTPALIVALRKLPQLGYLDFGGKKWPIHFARQQTGDKGRTILAVVAEPIYYLGAGQVNAKPREGFDLAVVQFAVDGVGLGNGTLALAAKLKAGGGPAGLEVEDYGGEPVKLTTIRKLYK